MRIPAPPVTLPVLFTIMHKLHSFTFQVIWCVHAEYLKWHDLPTRYVFKQEVRKYVCLTVIAQRLNELTFFLPELFLNDAFP